MSLDDTNVSQASARYVCYRLAGIGVRIFRPNTTGTHSKSRMLLCVFKIDSRV